MRAVVYRGPKELAVEEIRAPEGAGALVEVEACGICGTDLTIFAGSHPRAQPGLVLGHEFVGKLVEPIPQRKLAAGTRVVAYPLISCAACDACHNGREHICEQLRLVGIDTPGGMAGVVRVEPDALYPVADTMPSAVAAQAEPVAVCVHAANVAGVTETDRVSIIGAGPIGVTLAIVLRQRGVKDVHLSDVSRERLQIARSLGFETTLVGDDNAAARVQQHSGADIVFECAGAGSAVAAAVDQARAGGKVVVVSIHKTPQPIDLQTLAFRELRIVGTRVYTREEFRQAVDLLEVLQADLALLVSRVIDFEDAQTTFERLRAGACDLKVMVRCGTATEAD